MAPHQFQPRLIFAGTVEVTDNDKHSSLLEHGINYGPKRF
jgi:hypothetical protein